MAAATNEITLQRTRYGITIAFMGLLLANQCVREGEDERLLLKYRQGSIVVVVVVLVVVDRTTCLRIKTSCLSSRSAGLLFGGL